MQSQNFDYRQELSLDVARKLFGDNSGSNSEKTRRELIDNIIGFKKLKLKGLAKIATDTVLFGGFIFGASCLGYAFKDEVVRNTVSISAVFLTGLLGSGAYLKDIFLNTMRINYANQKIREYETKLSDYVEVRDYEATDNLSLR